MSEDTKSGDSVLQMILNPSTTLANWFVGIGALGIFLGILNLMGEIHPNYKVSWAGVLTLEATNRAFENLDTAPSFVLSDAVFMILCAALVALGIKTINSQDGGIGGWVKSIFVNNVWLSLADPDNGGWFKTFGAWCLLLGVINYLYFGITAIGWIDPGVYSVTIAFLAFGFGLLYSASSNDAEESSA